MNIRAADLHGLNALPDATIASIIARHVAIRPESPAVIKSMDDVLTYGALGAQIEDFGAALRTNGIGPSARVAIILPDGFELAVAIVAAACHAVAVPVNPKLTATEIDNLFARLRIGAIVTSSKIDTAARGLADRLGIRQLEVTGSGPGAFKISGGSTAKSAQRDSVEPERDLQPDDLALILLTSASTGRPKLVPLTHRNLVASADRRKAWYDLTPNDRALCMAPLYYSQAINGELVTPLLVGASTTCPDRDADGDFIDWLTNFEPTWFATSPTFCLTALEQARARGAPIPHRLRFIRAGLAALSATMRQELEEVFGVPALEYYATTETGAVAANAVAPENRKAGTVGKPWPNEVAIRAEDGRLLYRDAAGEIMVRGPMLMRGYLDDEEANRATFVDGWFRTGDLGSIDAEGFLMISGRVKEFINRGGEKISPYEIECALLLHPCVREAAAFSVPHPRLGENLVAAVVLKPGATTTPTEIKIFLSEHLAPFKIPQQVLVKTEFPKGGTGKVLRRQLSEEALHSTREVAPPLAPLHSQILEIWQSLIGRNDIGIDDDFFEAGGDSLLAIQMVCEVEKATHQQIPPSALRNVFTIRELAETVLRGSSATPELVTCAKQGRGTPFLFCHGDYTSRGLYALKLVDMLKGNQPVILVHPYPNPEPNLTIEDMAQAYIPRILDAHPTGALQIGGHCNGGVLAWEIARQLEHLGREVQLIALIDVPSLNARPTFRAIAQLNKLVVAVAPKNLSEKFALDGIRAVWAKIRSFSGPYSRAITNYIPPKTTTRVVCIISEECRPKKEYCWMPWTKLADEVSCQYVPGSHLSSITKHVDVVASLLDDLMSPPQVSRST